MVAMVATGIPWGYPDIGISIRIFIGTFIEHSWGYNGVLICIN
jgi:hypothetical protein